MAYGDFKDWTTRTATKNSKYGLVSMVDKFFDKKTSVTRANEFAVSGIKNGNISNNELAEEIHKSIIKRFSKRKVQSPFIDNTRGRINFYCVLFIFLANMHGFFL